MRNYILIFLAVFLGIAVVGGVIGWFVQAAHTKAMIEDAVAEFNKGPAKITYDAVEVSGFPLEMRAVIFNPRVSGRLDGLFAPHADDIPAWDEEFALGGNVTLAVNIFSDRYEFAVNGNWRNKSRIGDKTIAMQGKSDGDAFCRLHMKRGLSWLSSRLWDFQELKAYGEDFLKDFRLADCTVPEHTVTDQDGGATLMHNGRGRFYISHDPGRSERRMRFYLKSADVEVTPEGDGALDAYMHALSPPYPFASRLSAYGKQNADMDISYSGPMHWQDGLKPAPLHVRVDTFAIANQAYTATLTLDFSAAAPGKDHTFTFAFKLEAAFQEIYDALLRNTARETIRQSYARRMAAPTMFRPLLDTHTPESLYALAEPAIPNLHSLGKITAEADLHYRGNREFTAGEMTLNSLELSASPYGITGRGDLKRMPGALLPGGTLTFTCANCPRLMDDLFDYAARVRKVADAIQPGAPDADPRQAERLKTFLRALAVTSGETGNDFTYNIASDGLAGPAINGKPLGEVIRLYQQAMKDKPAQ